MPVLATRGGGSVKGFGLFGGEAPQVPFIGTVSYLGTRMVPGGNVPSIYYANNQWIAIQNYGSTTGYKYALYTSSNASTWTLQTSDYTGPTNPRFFGYTSAGYYVLPSTLGRIAYSTDLINWTFKTVNASAGSLDGDVSPSNGMLFADYDGKYAYMTGGNPTGSWTTGTFSQVGSMFITWAGGNNWLYANMYAAGTKGIFRMTSLGGAVSNVNSYIPYAALSRNKDGTVIIAQNGNNTGDSRRSADGGASWSTISLGFGVYGQMDADTSGNFYGGGYTDNKLMYSTSAGSSWSSVNWNAKTSNTGRVAAGSSNTAFVRTYGNMVKVTSSGSTLTNQYSDYGASGITAINKIGYGNGIWLLSKTPYYSTEAYIATSTDNGLTWTDNSNLYSTIGRGPNKISYQLGYYWCGFGNSGAGDSLAYSSNGTSWTKVTRPAGATSGISGSAQVVSNGSSLACTFDQNGKVWYSTSLPGSWSAATISGVTGLDGIAYGNGVFVVTDGSGGIWTSTNGSSWTARTSGVGSSTYLSWSSKANLFLACVDGTTIITSSDGITWTSRTLNPGLLSYQYWGTSDGFVGYASGTFITSTNGISWVMSSDRVSNGVVANETLPNLNDLATNGSGKYIFLTAVEYGLAST